MAITINSGTNGNLNSTNYKTASVPATQGNVVETVNAYNEQVKLHYMDKSEVRGDTNALQTSIQYLVEQLVKNTTFTSKTITADETTDTVKSLTSVTSFSEDVDGDKSFDASGLIQKVNIIANLLSGTTDATKQTWVKDAIGNNVGGKEATVENGEVTSRTSQFVENVPVIGMTRADGEGYTASLGYEDGKQVLRISGLSEVDKVVDMGEGKTDIKKQSVAEKVVLSEKQVANMIESSVVTVLGGYDNQIGAILGFLLSTQDTIPASFEAVLKNNKNTHIGNAPLYVEKYDPNTNTYVLRDLNGLSNFTGEKTTDFTFDGKECTDTLGYWTVSIENNTWKNLKVVGGKDEITYLIPIPQYVFEADFGYYKGETLKFVTSYNVLNGNTVIIDDTVNENKFSSNGKAAIELPLGSVPTFNVPNGVISLHNTLFGINNNVGGFKDDANKKYIDENQKVSCGYYTVKVAQNNETSNTDLTGSNYEGNNVVIDVSSVSYTGHTLNNTTQNGETVASNKITYKAIASDIKDGLVWTLNKITLTYDTDGGSEIASEEYDYGSEVVLDKVPTREGYDFYGWEVQGGSN